MINIGFRLCYLGIFHYHLWLQTWIQFTEQFMGKYTWHSREYAIWAKSAAKQTRDRVIISATAVVCNSGSSGFWLQNQIFQWNFIMSPLYPTRFSFDILPKLCGLSSFKVQNRILIYQLWLYLLYFYLKRKLKCVKFVLLFNFYCKCSVLDGLKAEMLKFIRYLIWTRFWTK